MLIVSPVHADMAAFAVAVIGGTWAEGSAIALRLAAAGHRIVGTRDTAKGEKVATELNEPLGRPAIEFEKNAAAAENAGIVILTVPYQAQAATIEELLPQLDGKILIDATVPLASPKVSHVHLPVGGSAIAAIQRTLGANIRVVSAFQNVAAHKLRKLGYDADCDVLVCADDPEAPRVALGLIDSMGLRGIDAGPICNSAAAEALTSVLMFLNRKYKVQGSSIRITGLSDASPAS